MAFAHSPKIVTDGMVFYYDTGNSKSYKGEPTTNAAVAIVANMNTTVADEQTDLPDGTIGSVKEATMTSGGTYTRVQLTWTGLPYSGVPQANQQFTISHWIRRVGAVRVGAGWEPEVGLPDSYQRPTSESGFIGNTQNVQPQEVSTEWEYVTYTFSWNTTKTSAFALLLYFGGPPGVSGADGGTVQIYQPQLEVKAHATPFVNGTRSATEGLLDFTKNSTIDLTNAGFDSDAMMTFDGTDDYIIAGEEQFRFGNTFSLDFIINWDGVDHTNDNLLGKRNGPDDGYAQYSAFINNGDQYSGGTGKILSFFGRTDGANGDVFMTYDLGSTAGHRHVCVSIGPSSQSMYVNGVEVATSSTNLTGKTFNIITDGPRDFLIGAVRNNENTGILNAANLDIPVFKAYDRTLSAEEVQQNFNTIKGRFGI